MSSADRIEVPIRNTHPSPEPEVGDVIEIEYSGEILETYPARIADVYGIKVVEEAETWDLIPMVMVNGTLYLDTGHESTIRSKMWRDGRKKLLHRLTGVSNPRLTINPILVQDTVISTEQPKEPLKFI